MNKTFIIENDVNVAHSLEAHLSLNDFHAFAFADGDADEIINRILSFEPRYIIANLVLPRTNGLELIEKIKLNSELAELPIFIFTHLQNPLIKSRCLQLGADYYYSTEEMTLPEFIEKFKKIIINRNRKNYIC